MKSTLSYLLILCSLFMSCTGHQEESLLSYVDTRTGTAPSVTHTAGLFGKNTEEYGQTLPAVLEPNGMNFWTPQTQDTEIKCKAPYYYKDKKIQGFRNSHWIVGGCTQDYGSMTLMPCIGYTEISSPRPRKPVLSPRRNSNACLLLRPSQKLFHFCRNDRTFPFSHFPIHL